MAFKEKLVRAYQIWTVKLGLNLSWIIIENRLHYCYLSYTKYQFSPAIRFQCTWRDFDALLITVVDLLFNMFFCMSVAFVDIFQTFQIIMAL